MATGMLDSIPVAVGCASGYPDTYKYPGHIIDIFAIEVEKCRG